MPLWMLEAGAIWVGALAGWYLLEDRVPLGAALTALLGAWLGRALFHRLTWAWARQVGRVAPERRGGWAMLFWTLAPLALGAWLYKSSFSDRVDLNERDHARVWFYDRASANCRIEFFRDGRLRGRTMLLRGPFYHPMLVIPGPLGRSVVCFSWMDTTYAAFAVDLRDLPARPGVPRVADRLLDGVGHSDFPVRACTPAEAEFARDVLRWGPTSLWAANFGGPLPEARLREVSLFLLNGATTPYHAGERCGYPAHLLPAGLAGE